LDGVNNKYAHVFRMKLVLMLTLAGR
jgi:hypothetical protein